MIVADWVIHQVTWTPIRLYTLPYWSNLSLLIPNVKQITWLVFTEVGSKSFGLVTQCRHNILALCAVTHIFAYWTSPVSVTHIIFFIVECGIVDFLCAMRVFDVRASSSPREYLCAKFHFCRALHCWANPRRKSRTQSLNQSPRLFDALGTEAFASEN